MLISIKEFAFPLNKGKEMLYKTQVTVQHYLMIIQNFSLPCLDLCNPQTRVNLLLMIQKQKIIMFLTSIIGRYVRK